MTYLWLSIGLLTATAVIILLLPLLTAYPSWRGGQRPMRQFITFFVLLSLLLPGSALLLYWHWGKSDKLAAYYAKQQQAAAVSQVLEELKTPDRVIAKLQEHLKQEPDSAKGWYLLGRLYASQGQYAQAIEAFSKANQLQPDDPDTMLQYAQALYFSQQKLTEQSEQLIQSVLKVQPENDVAINLLAIAAYEAKDYQKALNYWEKLAAKYPPESVASRKLLEVIAKTQAALQKDNQVNSPALIKIPVYVTLDPKLNKQVMPEDTVFIYARAAKGPPMPLAIIRKQVKDLPVEVILDETMSMLNTMQLKDFQEVKILARISKSGQAIPQPGDLIGESGVLQVSEIKQTVKIEINRKI